MQPLELELLLRTRKKARTRVQRDHRAATLVHASQRLSTCR